MRLEWIAEPCRNFSIMSRLIIPADPLDGREKMVMGNYAANNIGSLHIVDTGTLEGESYPFPDDSGAWALQYLPERGELLVGTCDHKGYLHCFDMKTRTFVHTCRVEGETYLWQFARGADGCVYAGTYPGCRLLRYTPSTRCLTDLGLLGDCADNHYSKPLFATRDGNIVACAAHALFQVWCYDVFANTFRQVGHNGDRLLDVRDGFIAVERGGSWLFFDDRTLEVIDGPVDAQDPQAQDRARVDAVRAYLDGRLHPEKLPGLPLGTRGDRAAGGGIVGATGQEVYRIQGQDIQFRRIPGEPPATAIMTLLADGRRLWGSCENGQTIFSYDVDTGASWNSSCVCNHGGEVYGMVLLKGKLYLTAYAGGDHVVYDPARPWNQRANVNPCTIGVVGPELIRPHSRSVLGRDGGIWTGWYAAYGVYGGGITRIDPDTQEVQTWQEVTPGQSIEHITAGELGLYAVSGPFANGLEKQLCQPRLVRLNDHGQVLASIDFPLGTLVERLFCWGGRLYAASCAADGTSRLEILDQQTLTKQGEILLGGEESCVTDALLLEDRVLLFGRARAMLVSLRTGDVVDECQLPGEIYTSVRMDNGEIYCALRKAVMRVHLAPPPLREEKE